MRTSIKDRLIGYLHTNKQARVDALSRAFSVSRVTVHKQLKKLIETGLVRKIGKPPLVFYLLTEKKSLTESAVELAEKTKEPIEKNFLYISPQGEILYGRQGFIRWLESTKQTDKIVHLADTYLRTLKEYERFRKPQGWIDATFKLTDTFEKVFLDKLFYADFYSLPQFGKTKLGALMLYAKQSQNRELVKEVCQKVKPLIKKIIEEFKIQAVAFIPPSLPRTVQFMQEFSLGLGLSLPELDLVKTRNGEVIVAQKTLEKLEERVINARESIFLKKSEKPFSNILLIDDAVGSGASMNETARKIKEMGIVKNQIVGFAVVGSFKGFEVIREV